MLLRYQRKLNVITFGLKPHPNFTVRPTPDIFSAETCGQKHVCHPIMCGTMHLFYQCFCLLLRRTRMCISAKQ